MYYIIQNEWYVSHIYMYVLYIYRTNGRERGPGLARATMSCCAKSSKPTKAWLVLFIKGTLKKIHKTNPTKNQLICIIIQTDKDLEHSFNHRYILTKHQKKKNTMKCNAKFWKVMCAGWALFITGVDASDKKRYRTDSVNTSPHKTELILWKCDLIL